MLALAETGLAVVTALWVAYPRASAPSPRQAFCIYYYIGSSCHHHQLALALTHTPASRRLFLPIPIDRINTRLGLLLLGRNYLSEYLPLPIWVLSIAQRGAHLLDPIPSITGTLMIWGIL